MAYSQRQLQKKEGKIARVISSLVSGSNPIGGGYKHCPRCNIYLCWYCGYVLQNTKKEFPAKCPMCGGEFG